jgi:hypothetical protein
VLVILPFQKGIAMPGSWQPLKNQPAFNVDAMLLLTDGSVMCHQYLTPNWYKLQPDKDSDYANGTFTALSPMPNNAPLIQNGPADAPLYFASAVLRTGAVFCAGGEDNGAFNDDELLTAEIYDPVTDVWTPIATPVGWTNIGDASSCVLPDGRVLLGNDNTNAFPTGTAIWDPESGSWSTGGNSLDNNSEEGWTLLPDGTVLAVQCTSVPNAQKYVIATNAWVTAGSTGQTLPATPSATAEGTIYEMGPQILIPDGRVFAVGASGHTALYTAPNTTPADPGSWAAGPDFPTDINGNLLGAIDAPAVLLPNGNVLCTVGSLQTSGGNAGFAFPTSFFEYDPTAGPIGALIPVPGTASAGAAFTYNCRLLVLPTGQVLFSTSTNDLEIYTPSGGPQAAWRPHITHLPKRLHAGRTYRLHGKQLNGLSQACAYGDDQQMATNYPLVRLRNKAGEATYCRTFDHSTMGVATGSIVHHTHFEVPDHLPHGEYRLVVIANGIASHPVDVHIEHHEHHDHAHDCDDHGCGHDEEIVEFDHEESKYKDKDAKEAKEKEKDFKEIKEKETKEFKDKEKDCKDVEQKHCVEHKQCKEVEHKHSKEKDQKEYEQKGCKEKDCPEQVRCEHHEKSRDFDEVLHRLGHIAERIERIEDEARRRPFIRSEERPNIGERALRQDYDERPERERHAEVHHPHEQQRRAEEHHRHEQERHAPHEQERLQEEERQRHERERLGPAAATPLKPTPPELPHRPGARKKR